MLFDLDYPSPDGMVAFPDWTFSDLPRQPDAIKETLYLQGKGSQSTSIILGGAMDQSE